MPPKSTPEGTTVVSLSPSARRFVTVFVAVSILSAFAVLGYFWCLNGTINRSSYQAVFLTSGQVYFGKVANPWSKYVRLTDVYYLQIKEGVQSQDLASMGTGDMTLIKLGKEMHGPTDKMEINREHILFIEDLKDDSKVVKAIKDFKGK